MFSILVGALLSSIKQFDKESIKEALAGTIAIFVTMFFAGIISSQFNIDLVPLALVLFIALLGTLIYSFFKKDASKIFLVIFSLYIYLVRFLLNIVQYLRQYLSINTKWRLYNMDPKFFYN